MSMLDEPLVLEREDWEESQWDIICKVFNANNADCIMGKMEYLMVYYGEN